MKRLVETCYRRRRRRSCIICSLSPVALQGNGLFLHVSVNQCTVGSWIRFPVCLVSSSSSLAVYPWILFDLTAVSSSSPRSASVVGVGCTQLFVVVNVVFSGVACPSSLQCLFFLFLSLAFIFFSRLLPRVARMPLIYLFAFVCLNEQYGSVFSSNPRECPFLSLFLCCSLLSLLCFSSVHRPVTGVHLLRPILLP